MSAETIRKALACGQTGCPCARDARRTHCPAHADATPSLSVSTGLDGKLLVMCFAGCEQGAVIEALRARALWRGPLKGGRSKARVTRYEIRDHTGTLIAIHERRDSADGKRFAWCRPDGSPGLGGLPVSALPLYIGRDSGPSAAMSTPYVVVTEGEKAADALAARRVLAVGTVTGAASTPGDTALKPLIGRPVILWPDNDEPGRRHMQRIADALGRLGCEEVYVVEWADALAGGDAADFTGDDCALHTLLDSAEKWEPTPPVVLCALLDDILGLIRRYVALTDAQAETLVLWTAHSHALDAAETTPYLAINSPEKRSGKTRLLEVLSLIVARAWLTGRVSAAVLVRKCDRDTPTLLLDESDAAFKGDADYSEALRGVLNSGYRRGGVASLCVKAGADFDLRDFSVFGPKAIAGIGRLPDTVADRAISITLKRRARNEIVSHFRWSEARTEAEPIRQRLQAWALGAARALTDARPDLPAELDDRAADGWEPLLAIADSAGGSWPARARAAALAVSVGDGREDDSLGVRLLADMRKVFQERGTDRLPTPVLLEHLTGDDERPWGDLRGKPLDARRLARMLKEYGVKRRTIREGVAVFKGYVAGDFADAWARYLPDTGLQRLQELQALDSNTSDVTGVTDVTPNPETVDNVPNRCSICGCADVDGTTPEGSPRCFAHYVGPPDAPLVRTAVEQFGLDITARLDGTV